LDLRELLESFQNQLENVGIACFVSYATLLFIGLAVPSIWAFMFSIIVSFVLSDVILNGFINGGEGHAKIFSKRRFANKGHAYVVFLAGIVIGTVLSSFLSDLWLQTFQSQPWVLMVVISDFFAVLFVFADLQWRFYELPKSG